MGGGEEEDGDSVGCEGLVPAPGALLRPDDQAPSLLSFAAGDLSAYDGNWRSHASRPGTSRVPSGESGSLPRR